MEKDFLGRDEAACRDQPGRPQTYLKWHAIDDAAPWLSKAFVDENFAFNGKRLTGRRRAKPRGSACVSLVDGSIGEDLGRAYVGDAYPPRQGPDRGAGRGDQPRL